MDENVMKRKLNKPFKCQKIAKPIEVICKNITVIS